MKRLDSCFLIDLQREMHGGKGGPATAYLEGNAAGRFAISVISMTAFLEGFEDTVAGEALLRPYRWLPLIPEAAHHRQSAPPPG